MGVDSRSKLEWEWGGIDDEFIITTAKGFKLLKQARLVSEQVFYDNDGRGWIIQFIDRPLVGVSQEGDLSPSSPRSLDLSGIEDKKGAVTTPFSPKLRSDSPRITKPGRRSIFRSIQYHSTDPYNERPRRVNNRPFLSLQTVLQKFPGTSQKLEQLIINFNDSTMTKSNLDDIRASVDRLLTDSVEILNQLDPDVLLAILDEYNATVNTLDQLLENHIMNSTYDIIFFKITLQLKDQDWDLAEATRELRNLDLGQVGLPDTSQHYQRLVSALNEFQSIGVLRTPEEKLHCLVQSTKVTSSPTDSADDLVPIMLLTVIRSGISNLASNLYYMKNFVLFGDTSVGEYGYSLSTLEAVLRYIHSHVRLLSPLSTKNQDYWGKICSGDLEGVRELYVSAAEQGQTNSTRPPPLPRRPSVASIESNNDESVYSALYSTSPASHLQSRDAEGNDGVLLACKAQKVDVLRYLVEEQQKSIDVSNCEGKNPLMLAVGLENVDMTKLVLELLGSNTKAAVDKQDVLGNSAVHICIHTGNIDILRELLKADPNLGLPNNEGDTPIITAAKLSEQDAEQCAIVSILAPLMEKSDLNWQNNTGDTAIHFITDPGLIKDLANLGVNPEIDNYAGWTPLLKWALQNDNTVVRSLLATGSVDSLMTDSRGYTPLHMACLRGNLEMAQMLEAHTPVDYQSAIDGSTSLQLACQSGSLPVVKFLLQKGANPELRDWANESPADMTNDLTILDLLDNAMLFWESRIHSNQSDSAEVSVSKQSNHQSDNERLSQNQPENRVIRVVRGMVEQDGRVRYIVKSGSRLDSSTVVTMPRSLDDFQFLRQNLLVERPDSCIPSLEQFYSPFLLSPSRPSKTVLAISSRRLDMFLNYLSNHPVLSKHELVWEFMLMPELQRDLISERSLIKQASTLDSIFDNFSPVVENLEHEETFFNHLNSEIQSLGSAVQRVRKCARKLSRCTQDVPQQLEILAGVLDSAHTVNFERKGEYIQTMKSIASTQITMYTSDIESIGNLFEDGTLQALKHPQELASSLRQLRITALKTEQSMRRSDMWWNGLSSIGEGALTALGGASVAFGAVGNAATSTLEAVSGSIGQGGSSKSQHARAASESAAKKPFKTSLEGRQDPPLLSHIASPQSSRSSILIKEPSAVSLPPNPSQTNSAFQPRSRLSMDLSSRAASTASMLSSSFSSIAAVASAATGQTPLDETRDKIAKTSSLLNCLRGSLFEELAHLQNNHTTELERAMRDFGARQLQIEKSRLRDMIDILNDLRFDSNTTSTGGINTPGTSIAHGSQLFTGSTLDLTQGRGSRVISRQPSIGTLTPGVSGTSSDGSGILFSFETDEKAEIRDHQRRYELQRRNSSFRSINLQRRNSESTKSQDGSPSTRRMDGDTTSEKIPFDD
ncbi:hypothetical protein BGZ76_000634 [Entomortierella beljakovae]|nr:hypothetical protein BGZ76_000634 [Entomortierella beljakovae]